MANVFHYSFNGKDGEGEMVLRTDQIDVMTRLGDVIDITLRSREKIKMTFASVSVASEVFDKIFWEIKEA